MTPSDQERAEIFARLLDALQEGVFVGVLHPGTSEPGRTVVANPALCGCRLPGYRRFAC